MAAKSENKTKPTNVDPVEFINGVEHDTRRKDALVLLDLMGRVTGYEPKMWGPSMVGFGRFHYDTRQVTRVTGSWSGSRRARPNRSST